MNNVPGQGLSFTNCILSLRIEEFQVQRHYFGLKVNMDLFSFIASYAIQMRNSTYLSQGKSGCLYHVVFQFFSVHFSFIQELSTMQYLPLEIILQWRSVFLFKVCQNCIYFSGNIADKRLKQKRLNLPLNITKVIHIYENNFRKKQLQFPVCHCVHDLSF